MKIFIVEDDTLFSRKLQFEIESTSAHEVYTFQTAERAVGQLNLNPDVVFLDHFLDGINGTEVIPIILDKLPNCKIVSISSQEDISVFQEAITKGAFRYIKKDANFSENLAKILFEIEIIPESKATFSRLIELFSLKDKRKRPLIFVVEDDETFNFVLRYKMDDYGVYDIEAFTDGATAINAAEKEPDILVLDYHLKKMTGATVLERFKQISPKTKVIIVSSQKEIDVALKLSENGAIDYLMKDENVFENLKSLILKKLEV
jgi:DNA-binding NtrC family response regulator